MKSNYYQRHRGILAVHPERLLAEVSSQLVFVVCVTDTSSFSLH